MRCGRKLEQWLRVAKLARRLDEGRWQVTIVGRLEATDLRRLERTCAPALERNPAPLDLQLDRVTGLDEPARLFVARLMERGAMLKGENAASWADAMFAGDTRRPREGVLRILPHPKRSPDHSGSAND
jgi:hypothetical protein